MRRALSALSRHQCNSAAPSNPATALAAPEPLPTRKLCCTTTAAARVPGASMADTPEPLSEYEQARNEKIARNRAFLAALGLGDAQSPQQARPVVRRPDTPEVVERPKASQDVVDALAKRYPSRRKEASLLVSALRSPGDAPCLLYTSPSPRDRQKSRMPSSA